MYRLLLGDISELAMQPLPAAWQALAPDGSRRNAWLAGRQLLARQLQPAPLPDIGYGANGKPAFTEPSPFWFSISHSGNKIALLISNVGEVGCDLEIIRPRKNWRALANEIFHPRELAFIHAAPESEQLTRFWQIWTCKEAMVKQQGKSVWQLSACNSRAPAAYLNHYMFPGDMSLATYTTTPLPLNVSDILNF